MSIRSWRGAFLPISNTKYCNWVSFLFSVAFYSVFVCLRGDHVSDKYNS